MSMIVIWLSWHVSLISTPSVCTREPISVSLNSHWLNIRNPSFTFLSIQMTMTHHSHQEYHSLKKVYSKYWSTSKRKCSVLVMFFEIICMYFQQGMYWQFLAAFPLTLASTADRDLPGPHSNTRGRMSADRARKSAAMADSQRTGLTSWRGRYFLSWYAWVITLKIWM